MQERWFVMLGFVPMLAGLFALGVLRRPEAAPVRAQAPLATRDLAARPALRSTDEDQLLGVIVAGHTADLGAEISGSVVKVFVREGARVREGEPLVYIDPAAASSEARMAEAELAQQMSERARAEAEHGEASDLLARLLSVGSGIPDQTIVAARAREATTRAALEQARAGIDVGKARIVREQARVKKHFIAAPFAGVVVMLGVDPGDVVGLGQVVARVISEDHEVRFAVPANMRTSATQGARVSVTVPGTSAIAHGQVTDVLPEVDAASGMVFARAKLEGAFGEATRVAGTSVRVSFDDDADVNGKAKSSAVGAPGQEATP